MEPRLEEAKDQKRHVLFVDAAHFIHAPFLGFLWSFARIFIRAPSGRKRFNVLAALHATSHEIITESNDSYINSGSFCRLLYKLRAHYVDKPITIVLDNARYQKCFLVRATAAILQIELLYLPPYSPNLNLIERLWKFVKKDCLYCRYYETFCEFKAAITACLSETQGKHKKALDSLLTLRFESFSST